MITAIFAAIAMLFAGTGTVVAAPQTGERFVTLVRHAESAGNASGLIDTSTPGPGLTAKGQAEAAAVASLLANRKFDGIYASKMIRTQQTAQPLAALRNLPVIVEPGFHEIEAGDYEGQKESEAQRGYFSSPLRWMQGDLDARIPGSINGHEFKARFDKSLQDVKNRGSKRPVIFSHGGTMMAWVIMSAKGVDMSKLGTDPIRNTGIIVVKGTPTKGWTVIEWNGKGASS